MNNEEIAEKVTKNMRDSTIEEQAMKDVAQVCVVEALSLKDEKGRYYCHKHDMPICCDDGWRNPEEEYNSIKSEAMKEANVLCRTCKNPMKLASKLLPTAFYCKKCDVKATIEYISPIPRVKPLASGDVMSNCRHLPDCVSMASVGTCIISESETVTKAFTGEFIEVSKVKQAIEEHFSYCSQIIENGTMCTKCVTSKKKLKSRLFPSEEKKESTITPKNLEKAMKGYYKAGFGTEEEDIRNPVLKKRKSND